MLLPMDIRIASSTARFGFVFSRRGIVPEACSSWFLPRIVGISRALEWCFSGRVFPATEALEHGLVRSLHEPSDLISIAQALAREIVDHAAPVSTALIRLTILSRRIRLTAGEFSHSAGTRMRRKELLHFLRNAPLDLPALYRGTCRNSSLGGNLGLSIEDYVSRPMTVS
jgi:enoyl-CoA hydratase/carnithine racemase